MVVKSELQSISGRAVVESETVIESGSSKGQCGGSGSGSGFDSVAPSAAAESEKMLLAGVLASVVVRRASGLAFSAHGRSVTAPEIVDKIGQAFQSTVDG
jgi:NAD(P)H-hydrate repair Nnr-like enzyme with NAD(P)H-hydrate dehydratase domain